MTTETSVPNPALEPRPRGVTDRLDDLNAIGRCICGHMQGRHFGPCTDYDVDPRKLAEGIDAAIVPCPCRAYVSKIEAVKARVEAAIALCEQECRHPLCDFHAWLSKQPIAITFDWVRDAEIPCYCDRTEGNVGGQCGACYCRDRACGMCGDAALHAEGEEFCSLVTRFDEEAA